MQFKQLFRRVRSGNAWKLGAAGLVAVGLVTVGLTGAQAAGNPSIPDGSIYHIDIADGAVGSDTIANRAIQSYDMNRDLVNALLAVPSNGVDSSKVKDGTLSYGDLDAALMAKVDQVGTGEQGPKGDTGPAGPAGPAGKDGAPGLANLEADGPYPGATQLADHPGNGANSDAKVPADGKSHTVWVQCAEGKVALGGGFRVGADQGDAVASKIQVTASEPTQIAGGKVVYDPIEGDAAGSIQPNGWLVEAINNGTVDATVRPWVTCATVAK